MKRGNRRVAGTATSARQGLLHHGKSGRILSKRWKTRGMRMVLSMRPGAKQGIQFQSAMRAADSGYGSQESCIQS
jgi:hypothetical protein